ncbi:response regulator containing a CheY-like receiver domain and a GGDEF domain [Bernardetia litoralis DSM 6794]|uniref:Response regulator containing a CheY-like receiver domain and a GGDEF domain n=1 Tax=Bernardetia litoralis (strain ATCC 23117 / DSM 6794 / NBRC 15988 / NCIMB 1366 / Fx l1 / Sio-4) TaxID=880071 RepID=I4AIH0_BERLS|nr:response regulator [Bernardetia litoralis]AFM03755.1 response regulator containing a CheY-like receiver domain and a GGDEF domain [Bernardetia litoralis DSM 6794]
MNTYTILVADDTEENLKLITEYLENDAKASQTKNLLPFDYQILLAPNGEIAFKIAQKTEIDLLITDWEMPKMNGLELISAFQSDKKLHKIPIIMVTGMFIGAENLKLALEKGAIDFISKPIHQMELVARVKSAIKLQESFKIIEDQKNKELSANILHIQRQNEILVEIDNQFNEFFKKIRTEDKKNKEKDDSLNIGLLTYFSELQNIKKTLKKNIDTEHDWENFQLRLQQNHPEFVAKLAIYKNLKPHELRFLTYLYIRMSDKEIARILNINYQSVRAYKSRVKKKLNIGEGISLNDWIVSL